MLATFLCWNSGNGTLRQRGRSPYARRNTMIDGRTHWIYMHRVIMNASDDVFVAHADGNGLNYRRSDLFNKRVTLMADWTKFCNGDDRNSQAEALPSSLKVAA